MQHCLCFFQFNWWVYCLERLDYKRQISTDYEYDDFDTDLDLLEKDVNGHGTDIGRLACLVDSEQTCAVFYRSWVPPGSNRKCKNVNPLIVGVGSDNIGLDYRYRIGCVDVCPGCSLNVYDRTDQAGTSYNSPYSGSDQSVHANIDSFICIC